MRAIRFIKFIWLIKFVFKPQLFVNHYLYPKYFVPIKWVCFSGAKILKYFLKKIHLEV